MKTFPPKKINILYLIDHFHGIGGTENHLARLVTSLDRKKFSCTIVAFDFVENHLSQSIRGHGVEFLHIPVGRYYNYNALKRALELSKLIKSKSIDIVQSFHIKSDFYGTLVAWLSGVQTIISSKRDIGDLKKSSWHFFLNKLVRNIPRKFIVVSDAVGRVVVEKERVSPKKLITIYNGIDCKRFYMPSVEERREARQKLSFSDDDFVVGTVAWLRPEKNYKVFFDAIKKASHRVHSIKAVAVGGDEDGIQMDFFKQYVLRAGIADRITFTGQVRDVLPYLQAFDLGCLVSGSEGFSNSIIEKMSTGLPMIVSDVGGNAEAVVHGSNGFVIPPNNVEDLVEALVYLYEHPEKRKEMGAFSAQRVKEVFTLDGMVKAYEELYESLVAN